MTIVTITDRPEKRFRSDPRSGYLPAFATVTFPYDPDVVRIIKDTVPAASRCWFPRRKYWEIGPYDADRLEAALRRTRHKVIRKVLPQ